MKKKTKSSSRFEYFYFDPYLFYEGVEPIEGGGVRIPGFLDQQENLLEAQISASPSDYHRKRFEGGNEEAIYEYAKESRECFQSPWVTDQIEKWRIENTRESREKLKRLFSAYIGEQRGKTASDELKDVIKRDQRIFYEILKCRHRFPRKPLLGNRKEQGILDLVKDRMEKLKIFTTRDTVELVYNKYKEAADYFTGKGKIYATKFKKSGSSKKIFIGKSSGEGRFKDEMEFINYFMETSLDDILQRSQELSLSLDYRCSRCRNKVVLKSERKSMD